MFEHVIIAEDQEIYNNSLRKTLEDMGIPKPDYAFYCDLTLAKIRKAISDNRPYDLLVTDLYFEPDGSARQLPDGAALIKLAKGLQPTLKTLVFSAESRPGIIRPLFEDLHIDGYVRKARGDSSALKEALERIFKHERYYPRELRTAAAQHNMHSFTSYDKTVIRLLAEGTPLKNIPDYLAENNIQPTGKSSMEKRLNHIKSAMNFTNNEQLVLFCREMGLI